MWFLVGRGQLHCLFWEWTEHSALEKDYDTMKEQMSIWWTFYAMFSNDKVPWVFLTTTPKKEERSIHLQTQPKIGWIFQSTLRSLQTQRHYITWENIPCIIHIPTPKQVIESRRQLKKFSTSSIKRLTTVKSAFTSHNITNGNFDFLDKFGTG